MSLLKGGGKAGVAQLLELKLLFFSLKILTTMNLKEKIKSLAIASKANSV
jgi:hypothetical protein